MTCGRFFGRDLNIILCNVHIQVTCLIQESLYIHKNIGIIEQVSAYILHCGHITKKVKITVFIKSFIPQPRIKIFSEHFKETSEIFLQNFSYPLTPTFSQQLVGLVCYIRKTGKKTNAGKWGRTVDLLLNIKAFRVKNFFL